jgi:hypothetical protein
LDIFINKKKWKTFSENELKIYIDNVFNYYKKKGFPYFPQDKDFRNKEFNKLNQYDFSRVIDYENKAITQSMHGLSLAWSYMPHSWSIPCGNKKTPMEVFMNDDDFYKVIVKRVKHGDNISDNGVRKMMKIFSGTQSVSNFRPTAAAALYSLFCDRGDQVWDMSSGFGGRLLGASLAGVNYIGTDPSTPTFNGLTKLSNDFIDNIEVKLVKKGSETYKPMKESLDFGFTSPPYYNWEKYTDEETQSYKKFPSKDEWINGFIRQTFENCHYGLKNNKMMAINIANTRSFSNLEEEVIRVAKETGFILEDTWKLGLSNLAKDRTEKYKYEPIFIFKKI